jgi:hypothetical protein
MKYSLDTEFIDTPLASELISLALVCEDGRLLYLEFPFTWQALTPWLKEHVIPQLRREKTRFDDATIRIEDFCRGTKPEIWAYYGAYDWYWFCRLFGGMMNVPDGFENRFHEFLEVQQGIPNTHGPAHHALNDAFSLMDAMKLKGIAK